MELVHLFVWIFVNVGIAIFNGALYLLRMVVDLFASGAIKIKPLEFKKRKKAEEEENALSDNNFDFNRALAGDMTGGAIDQQNGQTFVDQQVFVDYGQDPQQYADQQNYAGYPQDPQQYPDQQNSAGYPQDAQPYADQQNSPDYPQDPQPYADPQGPSDPLQGMPRNDPEPNYYDFEQKTQIYIRPKQSSAPRQAPQPYAGQQNAYGARPYGAPPMNPMPQNNGYPYGNAPEATADICLIAKKLAGSYQAAAEKKGISLSTSIDPDSYIVKGDTDKLIQSAQAIMDVLLQFNVEKIKISTIIYPTKVYLSLIGKGNIPTKQDLDFALIGKIGEESAAEKAKAYIEQLGGKFSADVVFREATIDLILPRVRS